MNKLFYLRDKNGYIIAKFEIKNNENLCEGTCYQCHQWDGETNKPSLWDFFADVCCRWDGCSHWYFKGEGYNLEDELPNDSYYHLCGKYGFEEFVALLSFIWEVARRININSPLVEEFESNLVEKVLSDYKIEEVEKEND